MANYKTEDLSQYMLVAKKRPVVVIPPIEEDEIYSLCSQIVRDLDAYRNEVKKRTSVKIVSVNKDAYGVNRNLVDVWDESYCR